MESLKIIDLNFSFNEKKIIKQFNAILYPGKVYALTGPSGIGKSTLASLIAGHLLPDSVDSKIQLSGKEITKPNRDVFVVHQEDDLFFWLTVYEQLKFFGGSDQVINQFLSQFHLDEQKDFYPNMLSGGMKKRLAIIRALILSPKVLILDEAFSALDKILMLEILKEMIPIFKQKNMIVVIVTHHLEDILEFIDEQIDLPN